MELHWNISVLGLFCVILAPNLLTAQQNASLYTLKGCFYDDFNYNVLPDLTQCTNAIHAPCLNLCSPDFPYCQSDAMTVELCFELCANQNARYFGLQAGSQCLCGGAFAEFDALGGPMMIETCNEVCTGNANQSCGGNFRMHVYEILDPVSDCFHPGFITVRNETFPSPTNNNFSADDTLDYNTICRAPSILNGTSLTTCRENNTWSNAPPICTIRCPPPTPSRYMAFAENSQAQYSYAVSEMTSYVCVGNDTVYDAVCESRGLWEFEVECAVMCSVSELPFGGTVVSSPERDFYQVGALVSFACDDGPLNTSYTLACSDSGYWNTSGLVCPDPLVTTPISTDPPSTTSATTTTPSSATTVPTSPLATTPANERTTLPPSTSRSLLPTTGLARRENRDWIVPVAVAVPLCVVFVLLIIIIVLCIRNRRRKAQETAAVAVGYTKKSGTMNLHSNDPESTDNHPPKKGNTLTHSFTLMREQFVKRVTLSRSRPTLPPKQKSKNSSTNSAVGKTKGESIYDSPRAGRPNPIVRGKHPYVNDVTRPAGSRHASQASAVYPSVSEVDDDVFEQVVVAGENDDVISNGSSDMLNQIMEELKGRVNEGFETSSPRSSARSSPTLVPKSDDIPGKEHAIVHSNATPEPHHYENLGEPKLAPLKLTNSSVEQTNDTDVTGDSSAKTAQSPESPQYATLKDVRPAPAENGHPPTITPPLNHDYVNVGRGKLPSSNTVNEIHHPKPPPPPPDRS